MFLCIMNLYSCVHNSSDKDSEEIIPSAEISNTSYESQADFNWDETLKYIFLKTIKPKKNLKPIL